MTQGEMSGTQVDNVALTALREDQRPVDMAYHPEVADDLFENFRYPSFSEEVFDPHPEQVIKKKIELAQRTNTSPLELFVEIFGYLSAWSGLITWGRSDTLYPYHVSWWIDQNGDRIFDILKKAALPINFQALEDCHELVLKAIRAYGEQHVARIEAIPVGERRTQADDPWDVNRTYERMLKDVNLMFYFLKKWNVIPQETAGDAVDNHLGAGTEKVTTDDVEGDSATPASNHDPEADYPEETMTAIQVDDLLSSTVEPVAKYYDHASLSKVVMGQADDDGRLLENRFIACVVGRRIGDKTMRVGDRSPFFELPNLPRSTAKQLLAMGYEAWDTGSLTNENRDEEEFNLTSF